MPRRIRLRAASGIAIPVLLALTACDSDVGTEQRPDISSERVVMTARSPVPPGARPRGAGAADVALARPLERSAALLARGKVVYQGFCVPCHGAKGQGDGAVTAHGFPAPPPLTDPRLREKGAADTVAVVTHGEGRMWPLAERIEAADRWAVAEYVEQLKAEGNAP